MIITIIFIAVILGIFAVACIQLYRKAKVDFYPTLLSSIGVLGTFLGIIVGLRNFDTSNISGSITELLEGLKTAFYTSIVGMFFSLVFTWILNARKTKDKENKDLYATAKDLADATIESAELLKELVKINKNSQENYNKIAVSIEKIDNGVSSSFERTNYSIDKLQKSLTSSFDNFSQQLERNNVESLVKVMEKVTEEFQKQMDVLIGKLVKENFNQLNTSVENLNTWQKENAEMIKDLTDKYREMSKSFSNTSTTLTNVVNSTTQLTKEEGRLDVLLKEFQKVLIQDNNFTRLTNNILESSQLLTEATNKYSKTTNKIVDLFETIKRTEIQLGLLTDQLKEVDIERSLEKINHVFYDQLSASLQELDNCLQSIIEKNRGFKK